MASEPGTNLETLDNMMIKNKHSAVTYLKVKIPTFYIAFVLIVSIRKPIPILITKSTITNSASFLNFFKHPLLIAYNILTLLVIFWHPQGGGWGVGGGGGNALQEDEREKEGDRMVQKRERE